MAYRDLREYIEAAEKRGDVKHILGAHWKIEMGSLCEIIAREGNERKPGLILFDQIPGYPEGHRALFGLRGSPWGIAKLLDLPEDHLDRMSIVRNWRKKSQGLPLIPPKIVTSGPILENVDTGEKVDVLKFPSPHFHERDGGRYIGTACAVIQREPDEGWVNLGAYRVMVIDRNRLALHAVEAQHGNLILYEKYFRRGKTMPVALVAGIDPALYWASTVRVPWGVSEYDYAGGIKGEPVEVIAGPVTGLPLPANSEIVMEGECRPDDFANEGPFGEWHGYYGNLGLRPLTEPVIHVKAVYYRHNPILTCAQETVPPHDDTLGAAVSRSVVMWNHLEAFGLQGIEGVWCHEIGHGHLFNVVSIKQMFAGHSVKVGIAASQIPVMPRYTIVVDEDIDPSNLEQVIWAMITRGRPHEKIQILQHCRSGNHDPAIPPAEKMKVTKGQIPLYTSVAVIDACRGFDWRDDWYPVAKVSPELRAKVLEKWKSVLSDCISLDSNR